jgi:hypothetical protein
LSDSRNDNPAASFEEARYMQERWGQQLGCDPFYNLNLSLELPGFTMAIPSPP